MGDPRPELIKSRAEMAEILDRKLGNMPEWRAFRAMDRAISALGTPSAAPPISNPGRIAEANLNRLLGNSYADLGLQAMGEYGMPVPTPQMVEYIGKRRDLPDDPERAKINVSSAFSHDKRIKNVPWRGGRAWWYADKELPKNESAG